MNITHIRVEEPRLLIELDYHEGYLLFMALMAHGEKKAIIDLALQIDEALSAMDKVPF